MTSTLPQFSNSVKLKYLKLVYQYLINHFPTLFLMPIILAILIKLIHLGSNEISNLWSSLYFDFVQIMCCSMTVMFIATAYFMSKPQSVYLVGYTCYKPPVSCRVPFTTFLEHSKLILREEPKSMDFQMRILERSGLGEEMCMPPATHYIPPNSTLEASRGEAELIIFFSIDSLDLLQLYPNSSALIISTEIITPNYYQGKERSMLLPNCLFRMGGAAILLSNRRSDFRQAKYRLLHVVRTHKGADDKAYRCVYKEQDPQRKVGISLSKDLMAVAGEALKSNITTIGPLVLPASEQFLFLMTLIGRKIINPKFKPHIPDFKQVFEHFCIHAGGRAVIDELEKNLQLTAQHVEASRMMLHRFGNSSSSSLWYELSYIEAKGRMKKGDMVWQIAFGSGFKCYSAVWKCNRTIKTPTNGPWFDCIDKHPVHIPEVVKM
ncbi:3-ketoacyl-CoA synthase 6 [Camellia lanceoleosa]|uniref:3-ketoacyl-CoA synthase 6 n=1 Tax=Camellia lanceoleosa TaxID=1840588 RepID=A0ACC0IG51_9ERIC|nr:3-ketoacyl-CoA synthase 6 [Camellia lanceoleosa]